MKNNKPNGILVVALFMAVTLLIAISGCVSSPTAKSRTVPMKNRVALKEGGPHPGNLQENQLTFQYNYTLTDDRLQLSGTISARTSRRFVDTETLSITVFFIDDQGTSIKTTTIATPRTRARSITRSINRTMDVPPNATAIAFGVNARFREDDVTKSIVITPFN